MAETDAGTDDLRQRYLEALLAADRPAASAVVTESIEGRLDPPTLFLEILAPALCEVGERWHRGEISVAREHWATETTFEEMERIRQALPSRRTLDLDAVVSVAEGEAHVLPARLVAALLEWRGWEVDFLGGSMPPADLAGFVDDRRPDLVALSVTLPEAVFTAGETAALLAALEPRPTILIGGAAFRGPREERDGIEADVVAHGALDGISRVESLLGARSGPADPSIYLSLMGARIREERHRLGLSQSEVAERADLTRPYLSAVERGRQNISLESLLRLAAALEVSVSDLLREGG